MKKMKKGARDEGRKQRKHRKRKRRNGGDRECQVLRMNTTEWMFSDGTFLQK